MSTLRPSFSIIIPTYARPGRVRNCLASIAQLTYPRDRFEVIVADDGSPQPPDGEVAEFAGEFRLSVQRQENAGPGAARNLGARCATGEFLAFTADDCAPHPNWLEALAEALQRHPGRLIGGTIEHGLPQSACATASHLLIDFLYRHYNPRAGQARFFTPNNMAVPANRFREIGGFDDTIGATGEDRELCHRWLARGWEMTSAPAAVVRHTHPLTLAGFLRQQYAYGAGSARHRNRLPMPLRRGVAPEPLGFYLKLVAHPLRYGKGPRAWTQVALLCASQVANGLGAMIESRRRESRFCAADGPAQLTVPSLAHKPPLPQPEC